MTSLNALDDKIACEIIEKAIRERFNSPPLPLGEDEDPLDWLIRHIGCPVAFSQSDMDCPSIDEEIWDAYSLLVDNEIQFILPADGCPSAERLDQRECWLKWLGNESEKRFTKSGQTTLDL